MLEQLTSTESINRARGAELLYTVPDPRWTMLLALLGIFRLRNVEDIVPISPETLALESDYVDHDAISELYWRIYRIDDDPKWIRESHYHQMLTGGKDPAQISRLLGKYYLPELISSADYSYVRRHDYRLALHLYQAAESLGSLPETALMRRASL